MEAFYQWLGASWRLLQIFIPVGAARALEEHQFLDIVKIEYALQFVNVRQRKQYPDLRLSNLLDIKY
jgi:hypothetical protein